MVIYTEFKTHIYIYKYAGAYYQFKKVILISAKPHHFSRNHPMFIGIVYSDGFPHCKRNRIGIVPGIALRKHYIMDLIDIEVRPSAESVARSCKTSDFVQRL